MKNTGFTLKYAAHPDDFRLYDTDRIRSDFLLEKLFEKDRVNMVYSHYDRMVIGGAIPADQSLFIESPGLLEVYYFLQKREMGFINIGGTGTVIADGESYKLQERDALYLGRGTKEIRLESADSKSPSVFYFNACAAHRKCPPKLVTSEMANPVHMGSVEESNARTLHQYIVPGIAETCQLMMGITTPDTGSSWNTMPPHVHELRMEAYLYFAIPENKAVAHLMGQASENRVIWVKDRECVISPPWSIHTASGTCPYSFIWGMAGDDGVCEPIPPASMR